MITSENRIKPDLFVYFSIMREYDVYIYAT